MKPLLIFFLLCSSVLGQLPSYDSVSAKAKTEDKHVLCVVTQTWCPPCKVAKKLLADNEKLCLDADTLVAEIDYKKVVLGRQFTPQLVLYSPDGSVVATTESCSVDGIKSLLAEVPLPLLDPMVLDLPPPDDTYAASNARVIRYSIGTQYKTGAYQSTYLWGEIDFFLSFIERYWNVDFVRVSKGGSLQIIQANYQLQPNAFAWAKGNTIYISPVANYGKNPRICGLVTCHEFGHCAGGSSHNSEAAGIMSSNGGTSGNFLQSDYRWWRAYQWRVGAKKPHEEPEEMRRYMMRGLSVQDVFTVTNNSNLGVIDIKAPRYKLIFQSHEDVLGVAP
jgi:hypothetical protein